MASTTTRIKAGTTTITPVVIIPKGSTQTVDINANIEDAENVDLKIEIKSSSKAVVLSKDGFTLKAGSSSILTGTITIKATDTKLAIKTLNIKNINDAHPGDASITVTIVNKVIKSSGVAIQSYA
jgi:hypothetical protein